MAKTTEEKLVLSSPDGAEITKAYFDEVFPIIDPSELVDHKLLAYKPKTELQKRLMKDIWRGLDLQLPAFRVPCMDPSEENGEIVFKSGNRHAVGHSPIEWDEIWKKFMPSKNSRSGTDLHWAAFMGKLMKYLIEEKDYSVEWAWDFVSYYNAHEAHKLCGYFPKYPKDLDEPTGSRKVGEFFDLQHTSKIVKEFESSGFLVSGGGCSVACCGEPLAFLTPAYDPNDNYFCSVGWLVLDV